MRLIILLFILGSFNTYGQNFSEFSSLSGGSGQLFSSVQLNGKYYYCLTERNENFAIIGFKTYKIDDDGTILDSVSHSSSGVNRWGWISSRGNNIVLHGIRWEGSPFSTIRHHVTEYDADLNLVNEIVGGSLTPNMGFLPQQQTGFITMTQMADFHAEGDTLYAAYQFLAVDSPLVFLGRQTRYLKMGVDGTVYVNQQLPVNEAYNFFFGNGKLYVQGSTNIAPFEPRALAEFNSDGTLLRGTDYDSFGSGEFLEGSLGGWNKGKFYISYVSKASNISGCNTPNAAIEVRDSAWTVLHRFKLPDCGYLVSGKSPFGFDGQGNVFYAAPHESIKKIMVYKFSPDFQLIWKKELDFAPNFYVPASQLSTTDGGLLLNCLEVANGLNTLRIVRLSAEGEVVSSTQLPLSFALTEPLLYPNPTSGLLHTSTPQATMAQIYHLDGQLLGTFDLPSQRMDLSAYPTGKYVVSLWDTTSQPRLLHAQIVIKE